MLGCGLVCLPTARKLLAKPRIYWALGVFGWLCV